MNDTSNSVDVLGIGNAIADVLVSKGDDFLADRGLTKGAMTLIDADQAEQLYGEMGGGVACSGGSAANTMVGVASLGGRAGFIGRVHRDQLGSLYRDDLQKAGVAFHSEPADEGQPTGRCLILVTPDAQRTMNTFLGAASDLAPSDIDEARVAAATVTYLEGYLWDPPPAKQAFLKAARIARAAGRQVALSLSDAFCVERHRDEFRDLVANHVDVLFANETEIVSLYQARDFDEAVGQVSAGPRIAALTRGADGAVIVEQGRTIEIPAEPVARVVDTTGAGDLYAAGFLFGLTRGLDRERCGRLGAVAAAEIIGHYGARPEVSLAQLVRPVLG